MKTPFEKKAYDYGVLRALLRLGVVKVAETGKETRLKRNHTPHEFYLLRRTFERANKKKKEVGEHVEYPKKECK